MRCFISVDVENHKLRAILEELSQVGAKLRILDPEKLHITMKFLGEVSEESTADILNAMDNSLSTFCKFEASLDGIGAFPKLSYMRVVWAGVRKNSDRFIEMQGEIDKNLAPLGFHPERRFHPHLTLARVKSQEGKEALRTFISENQERSFGDFTVSSVRLKKSVLMPEGPVYSTLGETKLKREMT